MTDPLKRRLARLTNVPALRAAVKRVLPESMLHRIRGGLQVASAQAVHYTGDYPSWESAQRASTGYDAPEILRRCLEAALKVKRGEAAYERDSVTFSEAEFRHPVLAGLLLAAARAGGRLTVLDFGGGFASGYFQHRSYLAGLTHLSWRVVEQPAFARSGAEHLADERLRFFGDVNTAVADGAPDAVLLSGVLSYLESPWRTIEQLTALGAAFIIVDRTLAMERLPTRLTVQQVPPEIYPASYPCWIFRERELARAFTDRYQMLDRFVAHEGSSVPVDGDRALYRGFVFQARR